MALDPLELATIGAIIIVFFLWGPQKIPELARVLGRARKEFDNASKEFRNVATGLQDGTNPLFAPIPSIRTPTPLVRSALPQSSAQPSPILEEATAGPPTTGAKTGDELLIDAARTLGIHTQGKTRERIQEEIIKMAQGSSAMNDTTPATGDAASIPK
jgi:Sec-independent protein translocase protein TatA